MSNTASAGAVRELGLDRSEARARAARRRAQLERRALLFAICALVLLVSLPRLQGIAIRENELDAQRALALLGRRLDALRAEGGSTMRIGDLLPRGATLRRRLADLELLSEGRLALRHGYLFELAPDAHGALLRAWPWHLGTTGHAAFRRLATGELEVHPNDRGPQAPRWSGLERRPQAEVAGWRPAHLARSRVESY